MQLELAQFRAIQANLALKISGHQKDLSPIKELLEKKEKTLGKIALLDQFDTRWSSGLQASAILFRYEREAFFSANLVLHENRQPAPKLHIEHSSKEILPNLISLHYYHKKRDSMEIAHYLWAGVMQVVSDPNYDYRRVKADSPFLDLAGAFFVLNLPIEYLPYPEGRKLALLNPLKEIGVAYIGELIQKEPEELEKKVGRAGLMILRGVLRGWGLSLGTYLPNWRPRRP